MGWSWYHTATVNQAAYTPAQAIPAAGRIKVVRVPGPPHIVTVEKEKVIGKLKLPEAIAKDPDKQVTATAQVPAYEGKTDAISVMDTRTGEGSIELKQEPLPFFGFENGKEVGARLGMGIHGPEGAVYARWTFARTGRMFWAVYGEAGAPLATPATGAAGIQADGKLMLDVSYRW